MNDESPMEVTWQNENKNAEEEVNLMAYTGNNDDSSEMIQDDYDEEIKVAKSKSIHQNWAAKDDPFRYEWKDDEEMGKEENIEDV